MSHLLEVPSVQVKEYDQVTNGANLVVVNRFHEQLSIVVNVLVLLTVYDLVLVILTRERKLVKMVLLSVVNLVSIV